jgi:hypothetical protein
VGVGGFACLAVEVELHEHEQAVEALAVEQAVTPWREPRLEAFQSWFEAAGGERVDAGAAGVGPATELVEDERPVAVNEPVELVGAEAVRDDRKALPEVAVDECLFERAVQARIAMLLAGDQLVVERRAEVPFRAPMVSVGP